MSINYFIAEISHQLEVVGISSRIQGELFNLYERAITNSGDLVRRESEDGRCKNIQGGLLSAPLVPFGAFRRSTHQPSRSPCCQGGFITCQSRRCGEASFGQHCSLQLHSTPGGDKEPFSLQGSMSVVEPGGVPGHHTPCSTLDLDKGEFRGRFSNKTQSQSVGVQVGQNIVPACSGHLSSSTNTRCICISRNISAAQVHDVGLRSECCGQGRSSSQMGSSHLSIPSCAPSSEGSTENSGSEDQGGVGLSVLAISDVVAVGLRHDGGTHDVTPALQDSPGDDRRGSNTAVHGPSGGDTPFKQPYELSKLNSGLNLEDIDFLSNHLAPGTKAGYGCAFNLFRSFCQELNEDPFSCGPHVLVKYIRNMYNSGAEYSTINHHRSSISKFHAGSTSGVTVGNHPLVSQAVKAVFRLKPPLPKYVKTFDISRVFRFLKTLPTNDELSLKQLSLKALFLLTAASISRVSSVARLGPSLRVFEVTFHFLFTFIYTLIQDHCVLDLISLEKQGRPGSVRGYLRVQKFYEDLDLCPVAALATYVNQVRLDYFSVNQQLFNTI